MRSFMPNKSILSQNLKNLFWTNLTISKLIFNHVWYLGVNDRRSVIFKSDSLEKTSIDYHSDGQSQFSSAQRYNGVSILHHLAITFIIVPIWTYLKPFKSPYFPVYLNLSNKSHHLQSFHPLSSVVMPLSTIVTFVTEPQITS